MIVIISAQAPPAHDGIGDYSAKLAGTLAEEGMVVAVWTRSGFAVTPIRGVEIRQPFSLESRRGVYGILSEVEAMDRVGQLPKTIVLQFNHFSWGHWGLNPFLPDVLKRIKARWPSICIAIMFHEMVVPATNFSFRVMRIWQYPQHVALNKIADVRFFSIEKWTEQERKRCPGNINTITHLPVGSNLPICPLENTRSRQSIGIGDRTFVLGSFGTIHPTRLIPWIGVAVEKLHSAGRDVALLHIGPGGEHFRAACPGVNVITPGRLPFEEASALFSTMDLFLSPFSDGISTRRGSMMAAMSHGIPFATTFGDLTDSIWREEFGGIAGTEVDDGPDRFANLVMELCDNPKLRRMIGDKAKKIYDDHFAWAVIAQNMIDRIQDFKYPRSGVSVGS